MPKSGKLILVNNIVVRNALRQHRTQEEIAKKAGVSGNTISKMAALGNYNGQSLHSENIVKAVAAALRLPLWEISPYWPLAEEDTPASSEELLKAELDAAQAKIVSLEDQLRSNEESFHRHVKYLTRRIEDLTVHAIQVDEYFEGLEKSKVALSSFRKFVVELKRG